MGDDLITRCLNAIGWLAILLVIGLLVYGISRGIAEEKRDAERQRMGAPTSARP